MDIRIRTNPTLDEFYHMHMLLAGRTGAYRYLSPVSLLLFLLLTLILMILAFLNGILLDEILFFLLLLALLLIVFVVQYIYVPQRIKKVSRQFIDLSGEQEYRFTDSGVAYKDQYRESNLPWGKYVKWLEDDRVLVLFQTDNTVNLLPKRCFSSEQLAEVRRVVVESKIPAQKISRLATLLFLSITLFGLLTLGCFLAIWFVQYALYALAGS
jgi:hypothetical protein